MVRICIIFSDWVYYILCFIIASVSKKSNKASSARISKTTSTIATAAAVRRKNKKPKGMLLISLCYCHVLTYDVVPSPPPSSSSSDEQLSSKLRGKQVAGRQKPLKVSAKSRRKNIKSADIIRDDSEPDEPAPPSTEPAPYVDVDKMQVDEPIQVQSRRNTRASRRAVMKLEEASSTPNTSTIAPNVSQTFLQPDSQSGSRKRSRDELESQSEQSAPH
jgi:hypothetical protein